MDLQVWYLVPDCAFPVTAAMVAGFLEAGNDVSLFWLSSVSMSLSKAGESSLVFLGERLLPKSGAVRLSHFHSGESACSAFERVLNRLV